MSFAPPTGLPLDLEKHDNKNKSMYFNKTKTPTQRCQFIVFRVMIYFPDKFGKVRDQKFRMLKHY